MRRRDFIALAATAAFWTRSARAQVTPVIGFLNSGSQEEFAPLVLGFHDGLRQGGFEEGRTVAIEYRWAEGSYDRLPSLASDLVRQSVNLIAATGGSVSALAAQGATSSIPIVFEAGGDPVRLGLVRSLNRPGGNITGVMNFFSTLVAKRVEIIHELVGSDRALSVLGNPNNPTTAAQLVVIRSAAKILGREVDVVLVHNEAEIDAAFEMIARRGAAALALLADPSLANRRHQVTALAARYRLPAIYSHRDFVAAGGLISYGTDLRDVFRQVGVYSAKILQGAAPADLPVTQPTRFELAINLTAAKALGLTIPPTLLVQADEVIE